VYHGISDMLHDAFHDRDMAGLSQGIRERDQLDRVDRP
jgi:hypothetical protein